MNETHNHDQQINELFESAPKISLGNLASQRIYNHLLTIRESNSKNNRSHQLLKKLFNNYLTNFVIVTIMLIFAGLILMDKFDQSIQFSPSTLEHTQAVTSWEISEPFHHSSYFPKVAGKQGEYALDVGTTFYADEKHNLTFLLMQPYEELKNKKITVLAKSQKTTLEKGLFSTNVIIDTSEIRYMYQYDDDTFVIQTYCEDGCLFNSDGLWKLEIMIDDKVLGEITIDVKPSQKELYPELLEQLNKQREEIVLNFITNHDITLESYTYIDEREIERNPKYNSIKRILVSISAEQEMYSYLPIVYLANDEKSGYILEMKTDGTTMLYTIINNNSSWELLETEDSEN